jgi:hypothetical protein
MVVEALQQQGYFIVRPSGREILNEPAQCLAIRSGRAPTRRPCPSYGRPGHSRKLRETRHEVKAQHLTPARKAEVPDLWEQLSEEQAELLKVWLAHTGKRTVQQGATRLERKVHIPLRGGNVEADLTRCLTDKLRNATPPITMHPFGPPQRPTCSGEVSPRPG